MKKVKRYPVQLAANRAALLTFCTSDARSGSALNTAMSSRVSRRKGQRRRGRSRHKLASADSPAVQGVVFPSVVGATKSSGILDESDIAASKFGVVGPSTCLP